MDRQKVAQFAFCPDVAVPSLQDLVCRFIASSRQLRHCGGVLPDHLTGTSVKAYLVGACGALTLVCK